MRRDSPVREREQLTERDCLRRPFGRSDAERAIYVDFEGNMDSPPSFVGILVEDVFEQIVLEADLRSAAAATNAKPHRAPAGYSPIATNVAGLQPRLRSSNLADTTQEVVHRAVRESRLVITWSRHEYDVLTSAVPEFAPQLGMIMRDGKASAKEWLRSAHPHARMEASPGAGKHRLKAYLSLIGYLYSAKTQAAMGSSW